ncbi:hypothetical protein [Roseibium sp.]|uniref:hypothetical protein n=1 Tax=Roseibium sp. TaxID=1936156 RepID=UPI003BA9DDD1
MIVSHRHKFIFVKTVKTAGTSIEVDLNKVLGADDIATPIVPAVAGHTPQNFAYRKFGLFARTCSNHMSAREIRKIVGRRAFRKYFVFCVEREPVDKCMSHYSMLINSPLHNRGNQGLTWDDYVDRGKFPVDVGKYTDRHGGLLVHRILKYETLAEELRSVADMLGFEVELTTKAKSGFREICPVSERQTQIIYDAFAKSNRYTGYSIPDRV